MVKKRLLTNHGKYLGGILFRIRELRPHENQIYQIQSHNTFVCCRIDDMEVLYVLYTFEK